MLNVGMIIILIIISCFVVIFLYTRSNETDNDIKDAEYLLSEIERGKQLHDKYGWLYNFINISYSYDESMRLETYAYMGVDEDYLLSQATINKLLDDTLWRPVRINDALYIRTPIFIKNRCCLKHFKKIIKQKYPQWHIQSSNANINVRW